MPKTIDVSNINLGNIVENFIEWATINGFKLIIGLIVISLGFKLIRKVVNKMNYLLEKKEVDQTITRFLSSLISGGLKIALLAAVLANWGVELTGLSAIIASAGVAIGLALQGSLSNFAGGFIILFIRPFKVGDYIQTSGYEGTVEQIGLFYTHLTTIDNKEVMIPNGIISNESLINYSAKDKRRVDIIFSVGYESNILHVKELLTNIVSKHPLVIHDPEPFVGVSAHNSSSIDFTVRAWCNTKDYWTIHFDLLEEVKLKFDEEGISIPYPQMDVNIKK